jgi:uncharacterized protein GlcG (DUF336 family)
VALSLADARRVIAAGERRARQLGQPMNIAVVDEDGNLVSHVRMDGAWIGSVDVSLNKAFTARAVGATQYLSAQVHGLAAATAYGDSSNGHHPARGLPTFAGVEPDGLAYGADPAHHADRGGYGMTTAPGPDSPLFPGHGGYYTGTAGPEAAGYGDDAAMPAGGLALLRGGCLVGALGVSGGTSSQDRLVAEAAARAF